MSSANIMSPVRNVDTVLYQLLYFLCSVSSGYVWRAIFKQPYSQTTFCCTTKLNKLDNLSIVVILGRVPNTPPHTPYDSLQVPVLCLQNTLFYSESPTVTSGSFNKSWLVFDKKNPQSGTPDPVLLKYFMKKLLSFDIENNEILSHFAPN